MDFGQPNVEIGRKMANGQLLFLALVLYSGMANLEKLVGHILGLPIWPY